jgi:predicted PurR-regulated permease PerM
LTLFGAVGLIVGPLIAALFVSVWYIYGESYKELLSSPARRDDTP